MNENEKYIYESPDNGDTVYRRKMGSSEKEVVDTKSISDPIKHYGDYDIVNTDRDWLAPAITVDTNDLFDIDSIDLDTITITDDVSVEERLEKIERRLSILEPKKELLDKYEVLQGLYEQYKAAEAILDGPDPEDEK